jgi:hypothetical protein
MPANVIAALLKDLKPPHRGASAFDRSMILLNEIVGSSWKRVGESWSFFAQI